MIQSMNYYDWSELNNQRSLTFSRRKLNILWALHNLLKAGFWFLVLTMLFQYLF